MPDVEHQIGVHQIDESTWELNEPLTKPSKASRGVYGGNLIGQALLVAMRSAPGFSPHLLHSHFTKPTSAKKKVVWKVQRISDGKTFVNRSLQASQDGVITYIANVSLTKKNSVKDATVEYEAYRKKDEAGDADDDDPVPKPFQYQRTLPKWTSQHTPEEKMVLFPAGTKEVWHKLPREIADLELTAEEDDWNVTQREISYYARWGSDEQPVSLKEPDVFKFVGLGVISDSIFLTRLMRILRLRDVDLRQLIHYYSVSLDHVMYFHDDDFDVTKWMSYAFRSVRFANSRVLLELDIFNDKGVHISTVYQEGLVRLNGIEEGAKL